MFSPPAGTFATYGTIISPTAYNAFVTDIGTEMTYSLDTRGEASMTASLNMGGQKINNIAAGVATTDAVNVSQLSVLMPTGTIIQYIRETPPTGWYFMNGSVVGRIPNPILFALIGTTYGAGDGTTTFNLPDVRGKVLLCSTGVGGGYPQASTGGEATHTLITAEIPSHAHPVTDPTHSHTMTHGHTTTESPHSHTFGGVTSPAGVSGQPYASGSGWSFNNAGTTGTATTGLTINNFVGSTVAVSTGITIQNSGLDGAHNNLQPYLAVAFIIRGG